LDFTDNLPAGMVIAGTPNASTTCSGGSLNAVAGASVFGYTNGTVAAGASCTVQVDVTGTSVATLANTTGDLTSSLGNSGTATDSLTVTGLPAFTKGFSPDTILQGDISTLTLTVDNTMTALAPSNLSVTDTMPAGMVVATPANASTTCTGGTLTATPGSNVVSYSGGALAAGASCTIQVDVTSMTPGLNTNTTGDLTSSLGNSGPASAVLNVIFGGIPIPALRVWALILLSALLMVYGLWRMRLRT
jgi:hypothetical protein